MITQVLLFEGSITLCLPLQAAIQGQESIQKFPSVYVQTISSIVVFYSFFGVGRDSNMSFEGWNYVEKSN